MKPNVPQNIEDLEIIKNIEAHMENIGIHLSEEQLLYFKDLVDHISNTYIHMTTEQANIITSSASMQYVDKSVQTVSSNLNKHLASGHPTSQDIARWNNVYNKEDVNNLLISNIVNLVWGPDVETYNDLLNKIKDSTIATPNNYTCYVREEKCYYRHFNGVLIPFTFDVPYASTDKSGMISPELFNKITGIEENANKYIHPDDAEHRHISDSDYIEFSNKANKDLATDTKAGLMSAEDKRFLEALKAAKRDPSILDELDVESNKSNHYSFFITKTNTQIIGTDVCVVNDENVTDTFAHIFEIANEGATIIIDSGVFKIAHKLKISKSNLTIKGMPGAVIEQDFDRTDENSSIFEITGNNYNISDIYFKTSRAAKAVALDITGCYNSIRSIKTENINSVVLNGSYNSIVNVEAKSAYTGIEISSKKCTATCNSVLNCRFESCAYGVAINGYSYKNSSNNITNNLFINNSIGVSINNTIGAMVCTDNIIASNNISRDKQYSNTQFTIFINALNNIVMNNITKGKPPVESEGSKNTLSNNII